MIICPRCQNQVDSSDIMVFQGRELCEECYLDLAGPKVRSVQYSHDRSNFMRRLKRTYSLIKQKVD